jgi:hypothetical protein
VQFNVTCVTLQLPRCLCHSPPIRPFSPASNSHRRLRPQVQRRCVHLQRHDGVHYDGVARARGGGCCHGQHVAGAAQPIIARAVAPRNSSRFVRSSRVSTPASLRSCLAPSRDFTCVTSRTFPTLASSCGTCSTSPCLARVGTWTALRRSRCAGCGLPRSCCT